MSKHRELATHVDESGYQSLPALKGVDPRVYDTVVQRRLQWDNLLWQVPVLSLTGQAFLFTIALSAGNSQFARAIAAALAFIAALLSMHLMARDRQAEIVDAHWLRAYEEQNFPCACPTPRASRRAPPGAARAA